MSELQLVTLSMFTEKGWGLTINGHDAGTGTLMNRPVEARPVWSCTISQPRLLVWAGLISTNGTMTGAT